MQKKKQQKGKKSKGKSQGEAQKKKQKSNEVEIKQFDYGFFDTELRNAIQFNILQTI